MRPNETYQMSQSRKFNKELRDLLMYDLEPYLKLISLIENTHRFLKIEQDLRLKNLMPTFDPANDLINSLDKFLKTADQLAEKAGLINPKKINKH